MTPVGTDHPDHPHPWALTLYTVSDVQGHFSLLGEVQAQGVRSMPADGMGKKCMIM